MTARPEVLVTGPIGRTDEYAEAARIAEWSARCLELIATYPRALDEAHLPEHFDAICVSSKQAEPVLRKLPPSYRKTPVAAVGAHTAERVAQLGYPALGSPAHDARELVERIASELPQGATLLWPRGSLSDQLAVDLRARGYTVIDPVVYETLPSPESKRARDLRGLAAIFFASPSAVQVFAKLQRERDELGEIVALAIGGTTGKALGEAALGFSKLVTLTEPTPAEFARQLAGIRAAD